MTQQQVRASMEQLLAAAGVTPRSAWTLHRGKRLHHLELGDGPPVVLLHGGSGGGANWFRLLGPLSTRFRVLAPDFPGFGLSEPAELGDRLGDAAADLLLDWMARNDVSGALVVGTSFGGLAALRCAQRSTAVSRLLLLNSAGLGRSVHLAVRLAAATPFAALAVRPSRRATARLFRGLLTTDRSTIPAALQTLLIEYLYQSSCAAGTAYIAATLRRFAGMRGQREVLARDELAALQQPVSIVWGARDRLLPLASARRAAAAVPRVSLRIIEGAGHSPNWERPEAVIVATFDLVDQPS